MPNISFHQVSKRYGAITALDRLDVNVQPGRITALLGPNGSGKTTSMRILLGLSEPTEGQALIDGLTYGELALPLRHAGALIDQGFHPNRSARNHLRIVAAQAEMPIARVDELLDFVGLTEAAGRRVGGYSLGMRQRLALATALMGDPGVLVLDEPFNGMDPAGITLMREFLRGFAARGGTVLLSSHLLAEVAHCADDAIVIARGRLLAADSIGALAGDTRISISADNVELLAAVLSSRGAVVREAGPGKLMAGAVTRDEVAHAAMESGIVVTELRTLEADLDTIFQNLISSNNFHEDRS